MAKLCGAIAYRVTTLWRDGNILHVDGSRKVEF